MGIWYLVSQYHIIKNVVCFHFYLPPFCVIYSLIGPLKQTSGEPLSILNRDASVLVANNEKIVSMHRALMLSQSINPSAQATGSHIRWILFLVPPLDKNHSEKLICNIEREIQANPFKYLMNSNQNQKIKYFYIIQISYVSHCSVWINKCPHNWTKGKGHSVSCFIIRLRMKIRNQRPIKIKE